MILKIYKGNVNLKHLTILLGLIIMLVGCEKPFSSSDLKEGYDYTKVNDHVYFMSPNIKDVPIIVGLESKSSDNEYKNVNSIPQSYYKDMEEFGWELKSDSQQPGTKQSGKINEHTYTKDGRTLHIAYRSNDKVLSFFEEDKK